MDERLPELSVFFPCYNEQANITDTVNKAIPVIKNVAEKWEVIIVNDGSRDNTLAKARELVAKYGPRVRIVNHLVNRGYGAAFKSGVYSAKYQWVCFTDADGQFDFSDIRNLIKEKNITAADIIVGFYLNRKVPYYRKIGSFVWQLAVFVLFGLKIRDIDCGFKLIRKEVIDSIPPLQAERGPFITSEFLVKAISQGYRLAEVGVHHYPRQAGEATGAKLNVILSGLKDLLALWYKIKFSAK